MFPDTFVAGAAHLDRWVAKNPNLSQAGFHQLD